MTRPEENKELAAFFKAMREVLRGPRYVAAKLFIENCVSVFKNYDSDPTHSYWWANGFLRFGDKWPIHLFAALARGFHETCLFDICDFRVAGAVNEAAELRYRLSLGEGLAIRSRFEALHMAPRRTRWPNGGPWTLEDRPPPEFWDEFVDLLFYEVSMDIMGAMYQSRATTTKCNPPVDVITPRADLVAAIQQQSDDIERKLGVSANHLVTGPDVAAFLPFEPDPGYKPRNGLHCAGRLCGKWNVYFDSGFTKDTVMLWHYTPGSREAPLVAYIYALGFTAEFQGAIIRGTKRAASGEYCRVVRVS